MLPDRVYPSQRHQASVEGDPGEEEEKKRTAIPKQSKPLSKLNQNI